MLKKTLWIIALSSSLSFWNGAAITAAIANEYPIKVLKIVDESSEKKLEDNLTKSSVKIKKQK